jgi:hypothetical protein
VEGNGLTRAQSVTCRPRARGGGNDRAVSNFKLVRFDDPENALSLISQNSTEVTFVIAGPVSRERIQFPMPQDGVGELCNGVD